MYHKLEYSWLYKGLQYDLDKFGYICFDLAKYIVPAIVTV